jgi:hypothetical protein
VTVTKEQGRSGIQGPPGRVPPMPPGLSCHHDGMCGRASNIISLLLLPFNQVPSVNCILIVQSRKRRIALTTTGRTTTTNIQAIIAIGISRSYNTAMLDRHQYQHYHSTNRFLIKRSPRSFTLQAPWKSRLSLSTVNGRKNIIFDLCKRCILLRLHVTGD